MVTHGRKTGSVASLALTPAVPKKLLIVDRSTGALLQSLLHTSTELAQASVECVVVRTVAEANSVVASAHPVMIFLDPSAVTLSSTACSELKRHAAGAPVVLLLNNDTHAESIESCYHAGADDCIVRPIRISHITSRLAAVMDGSVEVVDELQRKTVPPRILLVGTDYKFHRRFGGVLEQSGYQVWASNPSDPNLTKVLLTERPDLVLLSRGAGHMYSSLRTMLAERAGVAAPCSVVLLQRSESTRTGLSSGELPKCWFDAEGFGTDEFLAKVQTHFRRTGSSLRVHERVPFFCPVELRELGAASSPWTSSYSYDLSPGGLFVRTLIPPRLGTRVELKIYLTTTRQVLEGTGVVAWTNPYRSRGVWSCAVGAGVQFLGMSSTRLGQLREICTEVARLSASEGAE